MSLLVSEHRRNFSSATAGNRDFSPALWADAPLEQVKSGITHGQFFDLHARTFGPSYETTEGEGGWLVTTTGGALTSVTDTAGGHLHVAIAATTNFLEIEAFGGIPTVYLSADDNTTNPRAKCWYEACVAKTGVANKDINVFAGLAIKSAAGAFFDTDLLAQDDFVGWANELDGDEWNATFGANGQDNVDIANSANAITTLIYNKLGFLFDPTADDDKRCRFFFNGVEQLTAATAAQTKLATWPDAVAMVPCILVEGGTTAAASAMDIAWARCLSLF